MTKRRSRIPAHEAIPGKKYKSRGGRVVYVHAYTNKAGRVVALKGTAKAQRTLLARHWKKPRPSSDSIPYCAPAQPRSKAPLRQITTHGWLPPDYPLLPTE